MFFFVISNSDQRKPYTAFDVISVRSYAHCLKNWSNKHLQHENYCAWPATEINFGLQIETSGLCFQKNVLSYSITCNVTVVFFRLFQIWTTTLSTTRWIPLGPNTRMPSSSDRWVPATTWQCVFGVFRFLRHSHARGYARARACENTFLATTCATFRNLRQRPPGLWFQVQKQMF